VGKKRGEEKRGKEDEVYQERVRGKGSAVLSKITRGRVQRGRGQPRKTVRMDSLLRGKVAGREQSTKTKGGKKKRRFATRH